MQIGCRHLFLYAFCLEKHKKIKDIMGEEMNAIGVRNYVCQWSIQQISGSNLGAGMRSGPKWYRFKDRSGRDMCLAMTHEEAVTDLARHFIDSYKQLPSVVYHIQTKFRDEPRCRGGLIEYESSS